MHLACLSKEDGICFDDVMFWITCAAASSSFAASAAQAIHANSATNATTRAAFFIKLLLLGEYVIRRGKLRWGCSIVPNRTRSCNRWCLSLATPDRRRADQKVRDAATVREILGQLPARAMLRVSAACCNAATLR